MTEYTIDYQFEMDITWFLLGGDGSIAKFSSGGAILPDVVAKDAGSNQILSDYFDNLPPSTQVNFNPYLNKYIDLNNISSLLDYSYYAQRGLVSFDKTNAGPSSRDITYHLVANPMISLDFETLPNQIKDILLGTRQKINFNDFHKLDAGYIPWASLFTDFYIDPLYDIKPGRKKGWSFFR